MAKDAMIRDAGDLSSLQSPHIRQLAEAFNEDLAPPGSLPHMLACTAMWYGHRNFENQLLTALKPFGLSAQASEFLVVLRIQPDRQMTFPALKTLLGLHPASLTYICDRLVAEGRVERLSQEGDRRVVVVRLTSEGERVIDAALEALSANSYGFPSLSVEEALRLAEVLGRLPPPIQD